MVEKQLRAYLHRQGFRDREIDYGVACVRFIKTGHMTRTSYPERRKAIQAALPAWSV